jgi:hypothetical protein
VSCSSGKRTYTSRGKAMAFLNKSGHHGRVYQCPECRKFHVSTALTLDPKRGSVPPAPQKPARQLAPDSRWHSPENQAFLNSFKTEKHNEK